MHLSIRPRRGCLVLCLTLSLLTLLLQSLLVPETSREMPPGKSPAVNDGPQHSVRRLALRLEALSSQIQRLTRDNPPSGLHDLIQALQRFKQDHENLVHTMERELLRVSQKLDQLLQRNPTAGPHNLTPLRGHPEACEVPDDPNFPLCAGKVQFLRVGWRSDPCYVFYGVDGSDCSILAYLSEREDFCPPAAGRGHAAGTRGHQEPQGEKREAQIQTDLSALYEVIGSGRGPVVKFMQSRIKRLARKWVEAGEKMRQKIAHRSQQRLKVLLYPGVLTGGVGQHFGDMVDRGGPLGELVQWADMSATLYLLGHNLTFTSSQSHMHSLIGAAPGKGSCPIQSALPFDLLYTDYHGLVQLQGAMGLSFQHYRCRFRVLDSFGTEPAFNLGEYAHRHGYSTAWGSWSLQPLQYMTMFPHTPDNSFMGFVTEELAEEAQTHEKENMAVVYGKQDYMWQGKERYLEAISQELEIHGTVYQEPGSLPRLPGYVTNHGLLPQDQLLGLLRRAKLFVGLGFPYEGPAPLESIASGCVFLQPRFQPPHSPQNSEFYKGKPTTRQVHSQHPYAENFIGKPYVWTVDARNSTEIRHAVRTILRTQVEPFTPYEFTSEGMLERVFAYVSHQDFCRAPPPTWPPESTLVPHLGAPGQSCVAACHQVSLVCEPALFHLLNSPASFKRLGLTCSGAVTEVSHLYPAYHRRRRLCCLQKETLLFSCAGGGPGLRRLCPCRAYQPGQVALCQGCL